MTVRQRQWKDQDGKLQTAWIADVKIDGHPRVKKVSPVNSKKGAETFEHQIRQAILDGSWGKPKLVVPTFKAFSERWLDYSATHNKSSTMRSKRGILAAHLLPAFSTIRLDTISAASIEAFKAQKLRDGLSKKSINNFLVVLSNLLNTANEWGELPTVPRIKWFKVAPPPFDFLKFDEAEQLATKAEPGRWQQMIRLVLNTGLRIGEVAGLRWEDVDLKAGRIIVRRRVYRGDLDLPKNGKAREVPLNETVKATLSSIMRRLDCPYVFPQKDGRFIRNPHDACSEAIRRNATLAGLRRIGWHTLRHTFASHLVMRGVPLRTVQELLGHSDYKMTLRYAHLAPEVTRAAVLVLDGPPAAHERNSSERPSANA